MIGKGCPMPPMFSFFCTDIGQRLPSSLTLNAREMLYNSGIESSATPTPLSSAAVCYSRVNKYPPSCISVSCSENDVKDVSLFSVEIYYF